MHSPKNMRPREKIPKIQAALFASQHFLQTKQKLFRRREIFFWNFFRGIFFHSKCSIVCEQNVHKFPDLNWTVLSYNTSRPLQCIRSLVEALDSRGIVLGLRNVLCFLFLSSFRRPFSPTMFSRAQFFLICSLPRRKCDHVFVVVCVLQVKAGVTLVPFGSCCTGRTIRGKHSKQSSLILWIVSGDRSVEI